MGKVLGEAHNESIVSAARKCALLDCNAANAVAVGDGHYNVVFLKYVEGRVQRPGTYCISGTIYDYDFHLTFGLFEQRK